MIPEAFSKDRIVAAFDSSGLGTAKSGMVFTTTHLFAKEQGDRVTIALDEITGVQSNEAIWTIK